MAPPDLASLSGGMEGSGGGTGGPPVKAGMGYSKSESKSGGTETVDQVISRLSDKDQQAVRALLRTFTRDQRQAGKYTRDRALADVEGQVTDLFRKYSQQVVPEILSAQQATGGYASTTAQRLANQAFATTVAEGAKLRLGAVKDYADITATLRQVAQQGMGISLDALLRAEEKTHATTVAESKSEDRSFGFSLGFG